MSSSTSPLRYDPTNTLQQILGRTWDTKRRPMRRKKMSSPRPTIPYPLPRPKYNVRAVIFFTRKRRVLFKIPRLLPLSFILPHPFSQTSSFLIHHPAPLAVVVRQNENGARKVEGHRTKKPLAGGKFGCGGGCLVEEG